jgi:hypothetical protein
LIKYWHGILANLCRRQANAFRIWSLCQRRLAAGSPAGHVTVFRCFCRIPIGVSRLSLDPTAATL